MKRRLLAPLMVGVLLLALGVAAAGCDDDSETVNGTTPATEITPEVTPEPTPENGAADGDLDGDAEEELRAEAEEVCPAEFLELCTEAYIASAASPNEAALCVTPDDLWFMETPQGAVGDVCSGGGATIVAIVGGE